MGLEDGSEARVHAPCLASDPEHCCVCALPTVLSRCFLVETLRQVSFKEQPGAEGSWNRRGELTAV